MPGARAVIPEEGASYLRKVGFTRIYSFYCNASPTSMLKMTYTYYLIFYKNNTYVNSYS